MRPTCGSSVAREPRSRRASDSRGAKDNELGPTPLSEAVFAFSKPVSEGLIRGNASESGYREPELGGIA
jgi:hypothetical protein